MAKLISEIYFRAPHKPGVLAEIGEALGKAKVNILHLGACGSNGRAEVGLFTNKDAKARNVLKKLGFKPKMRKKVYLSLANKPGSGARAFKKLAKNKINIKSIMATYGGKREAVIMDTSNNNKAAKVL